MAKRSGKKSGKSRGNGAAKAAVVSAASPVAQTPSAAAAPVLTDVSTRAHEIWIARGRPTPGTPLEDWLQAEREIFGATRPQGA